MSQQIIRIGDLLVEHVSPGDLIKSDLINAIVQNLVRLNEAASGTSTTGLIVVPNFVGRTLSDARSILTQATTHLNLGAVFDASGVGFSGADSTVQTRLIINQVPASGSRVASGTAVALVLAVPPSTGGGTTPTSTRPTITTIVGPRVGEARIGDPVTINGSNFDLTASNNQVFFGGARAPNPSSSLGTSLVVEVPEIATPPSGGTPGVPVTVRVPGRTPEDTSLPHPVTVLPRAAVPRPTISGVVTPAANDPNIVTRGDSITVNGAGFASTAARNRVLFNATEVTPSTTGSAPTALVATVPNLGLGRFGINIRVRNLDIPTEEGEDRTTSVAYTAVTYERLAT